MADYTIRIENNSNETNRDLDKVDKRLKELQKPVKVNLQLPSLGDTLRGVQEVGKALQYTYGIARNVYPPLQDIETVGIAIGNSFKNAAKAAYALTQATPGRTLAISLQGAVVATETLIERTARLGFAIFGITQSVNVLKAAYGGMIDTTIGREIRLQEVMLRTQTTIAATNKVIKDGVEIRDPFQSVLALRQPVEKAIDDIRVKSLEIAGTTSEAIIQVFGIVSSQIGQVGGSIEDAKKLALSFSAALGTIGMSDPGLAVQEVGSMLRGDIDNNSILARSLGITNKDIQKARQAGDLIEFITKRLAAFTAGQKIQAQSFSGITSNMLEFQQEFQRAFGKPMLQPMLDGLAEVYRRTQIIVKPAMGIAEAMGRAGAAVGQGIFSAAGASTRMQNFDDNAQKKLFLEMERAATDAFLKVQQEVEKIRPTIAKFVDQFVRAFTMVGAGLKDLAVGFASLKFEQFKIMLSSFATLGAIMNNTVIPALSQILTLYGQLISMPPFQALNQLVLQFQLLEKIGVLPLARIAFIIPGVLKTIGQITSVVQSVIAAVGAALTKLGVWISTAIAAISTGLSGLLANLVTIGTLAIQWLLRLGQTVSRTISMVLTELSMFVAQALPKFPILAEAIRSTARAFNNIQVGAKQAAESVEIQVIKMLLALEKLQVSAQDVTNKVQSGFASLGAGITRVAGAIGTAIKGLVLGMLSFFAQLLVMQVIITAVFDSVGRFMRRNEEIASKTATEMALKRLSTAYKDVGDNASYAAKKAKEADEAQVNQRWDELTAKIKETGKAINDLTYDMNNAGIQSWQEFGLSILSAIAASYGGDTDWTGMQKERMQELLDERKEALEEQNRIANQKDREQQESNIKILAQRRIDITKELQQLERNHENVIFQLRQQSAQRASEILSLEADVRIRTAERYNAKLLEGQEGLKRNVMQGINEYLATKMRGEQTIENNRRALTIEINNMEKSIADYRFETEKNIANIRKVIGKYEADVADHKVRQARIEGQARAAGEAAAAGAASAITAPGVRSGFLVGSTGNSTGPHLDIRGANRESVVQEALAIVKALQKQGVAYMELPNLGKLEPGSRNILGLKDEKELLRRLRREQVAHDSTRGRAPGASYNAIDISLPEGTLIPMPTTAPRWGGGGGWQATSTMTGNLFLHGLPTSTASGASMGPTTVTGRPIGTKSTLGGKPVTWNGVAWVGADGKPPQAAAPATPSPIAPPPAPDLDSLFKTQTSQQAALTRGIAAQMQRINTIKEQLINAETKEQFDKILRQSLPVEGLQEYETALRNTRIGLEQFKKVAEKVYDPKQLALVVEHEQRLANLAESRKQAMEAITMRRDAKNGALSEQERAELTAKVNKWYEDQLVILTKINQKREEGLAMEQEQARILKVITDLQNLNFNKEQEKISLLTSLAAVQMRLKPDDFVGNRLLKAASDTANYRLQLKRDDPTISDEALEEAVSKFGEAARKAAIELGTLEKAVKKQADAWAKGSELAKEMTGGLSNSFRTLMSGGDLAEASGSVTAGLTNRLMDQLLEASFRPMEERMTKIFAKMFGAETGPLPENTSATTKNTEAITALTANIASLAAGAANNIVPGPMARSEAFDGSLDLGYNSLALPNESYGSAFSSLKFSPESAFGPGGDALATSLQDLHTSASTATSSVGDLSGTFQKLNPAAAQAGGGLMGLLGGLTTFAAGVATIVGGVSQMGKGGTYNTLSGLAGIFGGLGGLFGGGFGGLFGGFRAVGGTALAGRSYIAGEAGPELINPSMTSTVLPAGATADLFAETRAALSPLPTGPAPSPMGGGSGGDINVRFESTNIGGQNYVTEEQFRDGIQRAAAQGRDMAYSGMQGDPRIRKALGLP